MRQQRRHVEERAFIERRHELAADARQDAAFPHDFEAACHLSGAFLRVWPPPEHAPVRSNRRRGAPLPAQLVELDERAVTSSVAFRDIACFSSGDACSRANRLMAQPTGASMVPMPSQMVSPANRIVTGTMRKRLLVRQNPAQCRGVNPGDTPRDGVLFEWQEPLARHAHERQRDDHADRQRTSASRCSGRPTSPT